MLEIVERILAALIILALLTLLIILAFPVPPRQTTAPTPTGNRTERSLPPRKLDVDGSGGGQTEAESRAEEARRRADYDARQRENAARERDRRRPPRRSASRDCPNGRDDCGCGNERRRQIVRRNTLPYWAEPRQRYAARDEDPDWFDERGEDPGPPPGTCPD